MIQETTIDPTLNQTRNLVWGLRNEMPYNYLALPVFSSDAPQGQVMRVRFLLDMNAIDQKLKMEISADDGGRIAAMMQDPAFGLRIRSSSVPSEDDE